MPGDDASQVVTTLLVELSKLLPDSERAKLDSYSDRAAAARDTGRAEWLRAYACAKWATDAATLPSDSSPVGSLKKALEVVREVGKSISGELTDLFEIPMGWAVSPSFELEMTWVFEAIHVASEVAEKIGWPQVPWEDMVQAVLRVPD